MANPLYGQNKADSAIQDGRCSVIVAGDDITLTAAQSGSTVFMNNAAATVQLPAASAGLNFKVILGIETTAGADILAKAGDACQGILLVKTWHPAPERKPAPESSIVCLWFLKCHHL